MAGSGQLERAVLQVLWDSPAPVAARDVLTVLARRDPAERELAVTTVLTVLDRLRRKGLVRRERDGRAHRYQASVSREDYVADLMVEALGQAPDRGAALTRFLGAVTAADTAHLRRELRSPARSRDALAPDALAPDALAPDALPQDSPPPDGPGD